MEFADKKRVAILMLASISIFITIEITTVLGLNWSLPAAVQKTYDNLLIPQPDCSVITYDTASLMTKICDCNNMSVHLNNHHENWNATQLDHILRVLTICIARQDCYQFADHGKLCPYYSVDINSDLVLCLNPHFEVEFGQLFEQRITKRDLNRFYYLLNYSCYQ